jgi:hypothetical protein
MIPAGKKAIISVGDRAIRAALKPKLSAEQIHGGAVLFEELGLCRGLVRADLAVVNGALHGYEIKSDLDSLGRLTRQVDVYGKVLDFATLVVGDRLLDEATEAIPEWWGVLHARVAQDRIEFREARVAKKNPYRNPRALAELLWLDEATQLLEKFNALRGIRGKPRRFLWDRISEQVQLEEIASAVRDALKSRARAQAVPPPSKCGASCPIAAIPPRNQIPSPPPRHESSSGSPHNDWRLGSLI